MILQMYQMNNQYYFEIIGANQLFKEMYFVSFKIIGANSVIFMEMYLVQGERTRVSLVTHLDKHAISIANFQNFL